MSYIPAFLRTLVRERAEFLCEYCLIHEEDAGYRLQVDHVISEKHGGETREDNLALACLYCNRHKGSDIASIHPRTGELIRLFNPRVDRWQDHFRLAPNGFTILALTPIGDVTSRTLRLNHPDRLLERHALLVVGQYPAPAARKRLSG